MTETFNWVSISYQMLQCPFEQDIEFYLSSSCWIRRQRLSLAHRLSPRRRTIHEIIDSQYTDCSWKSRFLTDFPPIVIHVGTNIPLVISLDFLGNTFFDILRTRPSISGVKPFKCNLCDKSFTQRCSLEAHSTRVHGIAHKFSFRERRPKVYVCEDCGETFQDNSKFRQHSKEHGSCGISSPIIAFKWILPWHRFAYIIERQASS